MRQKRQGQGRMRRAILTAVGALAAVSMTLCGCSKITEGWTSAEEKASAKGDTGAESEPAVEGGNAKKSGPLAESEDAMGSKSAAEGENVTENTPVQSVENTFSVMGDSVSTYQGYNPMGYRVFFPESGDVTDVSDTWWQRVADDLELTLLSNGSSSASTVSGDSTGTDDTQCACNELRTDALFGPEGECPDRIIVYLGANDMIQAVPLGDNDGTRAVEEGVTASFSDAYTLMLDKLQAKYPPAEIYCCTLHPMGNYGIETPYVAFVNGIGLTAEDYGRVIAQIAEKRGLSVIDLYDCGISVENLQEMTSDGVHPTAEGMRCIAEAVEEALSCR